MCSCLATPLMVTVLLPFLKQAPSENSQFRPLPALLLGQATGPVVPSVVAFWQTPVLGSHGPSPTAFLPSAPPMQVWNTWLSVKPPKESGNWFATELQDSKWPISCCISTPPSSAAHGTWFCCAAVAYSAWKVCGVPPHVREFVFMKPLASLATMKPVWPVVRSVTVVRNPAAVSWRVACTLSPGFIFSVLSLGAKLASFNSCGLGGPAGTPSV